MAQIGDEGDAGGTATPAPDPAPDRAAPGRGAAGRVLLVATLTIAWLVSIPYMWKSVTTVPSAARLQEMQSRIMHVPSPTTFLRTTGQSFLELAMIVLLLWPGWRRFWLIRLGFGFLALAAWSVLTVPLELTELERVHHAWLLAGDAVLLLAFVVTVVARVVGVVQPARKRRAE